MAKKIKGSIPMPYRLAVETHPETGELATAIYPGEKGEFPYSIELSINKLGRAVATTTTGIPTSREEHFYVVRAQERGRVAAEEYQKKLRNSKKGGDARKAAAEVDSAVVVRRANEYRSRPGHKYDRGTLSTSAMALALEKSLSKTRDSAGKSYSKKRILSILNRKNIK